MMRCNSSAFGGVLHHRLVPPRPCIQTTQHTQHNRAATIRVHAAAAPYVEKLTACEADGKWEEVIELMTEV